MTDKRFTETVTIQRPLTYPLSDMVYFVVALEKAGLITRSPALTDAELVKEVRSFWDYQHGED